MQFVPQLEFQQLERLIQHPASFLWDQLLFLLQVLSSTSNPFYRAETVWRAVTWEGALLLKESAQKHLGLVVITWTSLRDHVSSKSVCAVTVTGYEADTVDKVCVWGGWRMTLDLFWQCLCSIASCSFELAKRTSWRSQIALFQMLWHKEDVCSAPMALKRPASFTFLPFLEMYWIAWLWDTVDRNPDYGVWSVTINQ